MRSLWITLAKFDKTTLLARAKLDSLIGRDDYRARMEKLVEGVQLPQKVIQFED